jgi:hypothetical protein
MNNFNVENLFNAETSDCQADVTLNTNIVGTVKLGLGDELEHTAYAECSEIR